MYAIEPAVQHLPDGTIVSKVYARIGLLGNPSDGYGGKVLALSLKNFSAQITLTPSSSPQHTGIQFEPNPVCDPTSFSSLTEFQSHIDGNGYYGGLRLVMAMTHTFLNYCTLHDIHLTLNPGFTLSYTTCIPRQRGLAGSSAIACATLNVLLAYFKISNEALPVEVRPSLILDAEKALGITAGLQDRIIQVYGGVVYMDFSTAGGKEERKRPKYQSLGPEVIPPLFLIYSNRPSKKDSGAVHSEFKQKWEQGDEELIIQMSEVADLAEQGLQLLLSNKEAVRVDKFGQLMRRNFELRKAMFGEAALGQESLEMIEVANSVGAAAKFSGSGGAVVALMETADEEERLKLACKDAGFICERVEIGPVHHII